MPPPTRIIPSTTTGSNLHIGLFFFALISTKRCCSNRHIDFSASFNYDVLSITRCVLLLAMVSHLYLFICSSTTSITSFKSDSVSVSFNSRIFRVATQDFKHRLATISQAVVFFSFNQLENEDISLSTGPSCDSTIVLTLVFTSGWSLRIDIAGCISLSDVGFYKKSIFAIIGECQLSSLWKDHQLGFPAGFSFDVTNFHCSPSPSLPSLMTASLLATNV